MPANKKFKF
jgi:hypothetical protein